MSEYKILLSFFDQSFHFFIIAVFQIGSAKTLAFATLSMNQAGIVVFDSKCGITTEKCPPFCKQCGNKLYYL